MNNKTELDVEVQSSNDSFYNYHPKKIIVSCFNQTDYQIYVHLQEILIKSFKEQDWAYDLQIAMQNYGANEFDVPSLKVQFTSLKTQLLLLLEIAKFYGLDSRMQLSEMTALFQKVDIIKRMLVAEVIKLLN